MEQIRNTISDIFGGIEVKTLLICLMFSFILSSSSKYIRFQFVDLSEHYKLTQINDLKIDALIMNDEDVLKSLKEREFYTKGLV